jgi:hypothetical protein
MMMNAAAIAGFLQNMMSAQSDHMLEPVRASASAHKLPLRKK